MSARVAQPTYERFRYPLGFLLGADAARSPSHYRSVPFVCPLQVHARTAHAVAQDAGGIVALFGEAVHPGHPQLDLAGIAALLLRRFDDRQAEIDRLVGRFVVVAGRDAQDLRLQTDAIAMRAVFYATGADGVVAGSHAKLVAEATAGVPMPPRVCPFALGWPGIGTPYDGVRRVPPNVELELASGRLQRFFPRTAVETMDIDAAWSLAFERAAVALDAWSRRRSVRVSLTAGLDSRTTLAAARAAWPRLGFFSYDRGHAAQALDLRVARDLAAALGLRFEELGFADRRPDPRLLGVVAANSHGNHQRALAAAYLRRFGEQRHLHVRSNLLELGRANLFAKADRRPGLHGGPRSAAQMADYHAQCAQRDADPFVRDAFQDFVVQTDFAATEGLANAWDLYFVEHRMGAWHAGVVLESDIAFDTVIAFNSREVVRAWMGVPPPVRATSPALRQLLAARLPEVAHIPVNPERWPLQTAGAGLAQPVT
jgi:hypothetical protein